MSAGNESAGGLQRAAAETEFRDEGSRFDSERRLGTLPCPPVDPLAYSIASAARVVAVSSTTIKHEIAAGRLPIRKLGRRTLIRRDDLQRWLDGLPDRL